jgi:hypothetical protein
MMESTIHDNLFFQRDCRSGDVPIDLPMKAKLKEEEQIGGFFFLEARDMDEAVRLVSNHPGLKAGPFEIRPT